MGSKNINNNFKRTGLLGDFASGKFISYSARNITTKIQILAFGGSTVTASVGSTDYAYHVFTAPGTFTLNEPSKTVDVLVVGGGGAGGPGGGGGAGGVRNIPSITFPAGTYTISVGPGGTPSFITGSGISSITASAGGNGGYYFGADGTPGGSGGGGGNAGGALRSGGGGNSGGNDPRANPISEGNAGGASYGPPAGSGGGGGGAGGAGATQLPGQPGAVGGPGIALPDYAAPIIEPAIPVAARPTWTPAVGPTGSYGGGGTGRGSLGQVAPGGGNGVNFTGGGGTGHDGSNPGGTGIIIIRYSIPK